MATRKPLVLDSDGGVQELQAGDSIPNAGAASVASAIISVPVGTCKTYQVNIADPNVNANSKILIGFGNTSNAAINDLDELCTMGVIASAYAGGMTIQIRAPAGFSGDIPINYMIG